MAQALNQIIVQGTVLYVSQVDDILVGVLEVECDNFVPFQADCSADLPTIHKGQAIQLSGSWVGKREIVQGAAKVRSYLQVRFIHLLVQQKTLLATDTPKATVPSLPSAPPSVAAKPASPQDQESFDSQAEIFHGPEPAFPMEEKM